MMALTQLTLCFIFCCLMFTAKTQEITYRVLEEQDEHTIGNLASDLNIPTTQDMRFQFLTDTWVNLTYFDLDEETGDISTTQPIDREAICALNNGITCQYELEVLVLPQSSYRFIRVYVIIEDVNDHQPTFSSSVLSLSIPETVAIGTKIPLQTASDPDVGSNSIQSYALTNDYSGRFGLSVERYVDNTVSLQLEVVAELDRETRSRYLLTLLAHDGGDPPRTGSATLNVTILDSNDNTPQFVRPSYTARIEENTPIGTEILQVVARDPDWGTNGEIQYSFSSSVTQAARQALQIDEVTGVISVKGVLDYEQQSTFQLVVRAANRVTNPVPDFTTVTINLIDTNDNFPVLTVSALGDGPKRWVYLPEDTPSGTLVAFIKASDPDGGSSGIVRISLSNTLSDFGLQEVSEGQYFLSTLRTLDREAVDVYNISIQAADQGFPARTTIRHFVILVEDINDNPPSFKESIYHTNVDENNNHPLSVFNLSAEDPDEEGINSEIAYHLWTQRNDFSVDASTGDIYVNTVLDREAQSSISLFLGACDHGDPILCSNVTVVVDIQDQNDHHPIFKQHRYQFNTAENLSENSVVGYIKATDEDVGRNAQLTYAIKEANSNGATDFFRIVPQNGKILTKKALNYEDRNMFQFTVIASDHGLPPKSSEVLVDITIQDENDNAPEILSPNSGNDTFFIPQSAEAGFLVVPIEASDRDQGVNAELSYSISSGNKDGIFGINMEGHLLTAQEIANSWEGVHHVTVQISDGGTPTQTTTLELIIVITDLDFNTSLPAQVFFDRFNLTAADFGLEDKDTMDHQTSPLASWPIIASIILGIMFLLIVFFFFIIRFKRRYKSKPKAYTSPDVLSRDSRTSTDYLSDTPSMSPQRKLSTDSSHLSVSTSLCSIPSKNITKWTAEASQANGMLDSRLGNRQMTTFGSNYDVMSDTSARRTPDNDAEVQRLLTILRMETDATSDNSNRSSYDSGQGGHDEHESSHYGFPMVHQDVRGAPRSASCPRLSGFTSQDGSRDHYMASPNCTPDCATLGHSDHCWNQSDPSSRPRSASTSFIPQQPIHKPISLYANPDTDLNPIIDTIITDGARISNNYIDMPGDIRSGGNYGNTPVKSRSNSPATDSQLIGSYATIPRGTLGKHRANMNNSHTSLSPGEHASKYHWNTNTPLGLSPITEDPMELTDSRTAVENGGLRDDYNCQPRGMYDKYGHSNSQYGTNINDRDVRYQNGGASDYYPKRCIQTCL